jgi:hypothetical protein
MTPFIKLVTFIITTLALATSAMANIGETKEQIIARSKRDKATSGMNLLDNAGKLSLQVRYRDGSAMEHTFGKNGRAIAFAYLWPRRLTNNELVQFQRAFRTTWRSMGSSNGFSGWESTNHLGMTLDHSQTYDRVTVFDLSREKELEDWPARKKQQSTAKAPRTIPVDPDFVPVKPAPKPAVTTEENDCLIVATEAHARLKKTNCWSRIVAFKWIDDEENKSGGHAAVFYQPTEDSNVFMYDKMLGSLDLHTQSHDLAELTDALNQIFRKVNARAKSPRWIGG